MGSTCASGAVAAMTGISTERAFIELATGTVAVQYREENLRMTVIISGRDLDSLRGGALITLDRVTMIVDDEYWRPVVGTMLCLEGGTELDVDDARFEQYANGNGELVDEPMIPVIVRDIYVPPVVGLLVVRQVAHKVNVIEPGTGVRATGKRVPCNRFNCGCLSCYRDRWVTAARKMGMEISDE